MDLTVYGKLSFPASTLGEYCQILSTQQMIDAANTTQRLFCLIVLHHSIHLLVKFTEQQEAAFTLMWQISNGIAALS